MNVQETGRPGDPKQSKDHVTLTQWRSIIIDSILAHGLQSRLALRQRKFSFFLRATDTSLADTDPDEPVDGNIVFPSENYEELTTSINEALYAGGFSILPVLTERGEEDSLHEHKLLTQKEHATLEKRISSSFLIVCMLNEEDLKALGPEDEFYHEVPVNRFSCLVFPKTIWDEYKDPNKHRIRTKIVDQVANKQIGWVEEYVEIPDFEQPIKEILEEVRTPIWIHGVRLPTEEDLQRLSTSTLQEEG